ncbi:MmpS family transport accessory protein [Mycobacterium celatum]|uniref:Probable transport accessory protein MmpS3 n=1 Tax=Mycobacterium celatum TaxID=28045 RepID=A0A2G5PRJ9_MYCCE|nr:MmpS family transport accessory protein [Mycobacterium celatum]PIB80945.1 hypothetical protein CQY23_01575 [Mycobacterium celatum]
MSGPNPPGPESEELEPGVEPSEDHDFDEEAYDGNHADDSVQTSETEIYSRAYSAPESEHFTSGPYVPVDLDLYDYDSYDEPAEEEAAPPRWPWVVGIAAIVAAIALVVSVSLLFARTDTNKLATPETAPTSTPPMQDEIIVTTPAGPRQVTYSVTGTKAPGDIISVTYVDASGRRRTQHNVYIPWSITVTPISQSEVGSVEASSLFRVSRLNCSITTSDGQVLSSNENNAPQTSC